MNEYDYHADFSRQSATMLKQLANDPKVYRDIYEDQTRTPPKETEPMKIGSVLHRVLLQGEPLRSVVRVYPDHDELIEIGRSLTGPKRDALFKTDPGAAQKLARMIADVDGQGEYGAVLKSFEVAKGGKELNALTSMIPKNVISSSGGLNSAAAREFREANPEYRYFLKRQASEESEKKAASFEQVRTALEHVQNSDYYFIFEREDIQREEPIFWRDEETGLACRCQPDALWLDYPQDGVATVWDIKISQLAIEFERSLNDQKYWIQDEHYSAGIIAAYDEIFAVEYRFLPIMPFYPFHITQNQIDPTYRDRSKSAYRNLLRELVWRRENANWDHPSTVAVNSCRIFDRSIPARLQGVNTTRLQDL